MEEKDEWQTWRERVFFCTRAERQKERERERERERLIEAKIWTLKDQNGFFDFKSEISCP